MKKGLIKTETFPRRARLRQFDIANGITQTSNFIRPKSKNL